MDLLSTVFAKAKTLHKKIVFPESFEERTLKALETVIIENLAQPLLIGAREEILAKAANIGAKLDPAKLIFIDPKDPQTLKKYSSALYEIRKNKGLTQEEATKILATTPDYMGVMAVELGDADAMISGALGSTGDTVRPALQIIKTKEKFHKVSGVFFMMLDQRLLLFADCAVTIDPDAHDLADIAIDTAETAKRFGLTPKIAMLSFSTNGSAKHPLVDKVKAATEMVKSRRPELMIEGEMQVDAALVPDVCVRKFPHSQLQGDANILIFPDLQAANIAYKLVERLAKAHAIGPMLQGLQKPINDLSRGCSVEDIVDLAAFTACEADETIYHENPPTGIRTLA